MQSPVVVDILGRRDTYRKLPIDRVSEPAESGICTKALSYIRCTPSCKSRRGIKIAEKHAASTMCPEGYMHGLGHTGS